MIGFLIFVVLVSGYILMIDNQATVTNVNMVSNTYSGDGVSFNIPANWEVSKIVAESTINLNIVKNDSSDGTRITVAILSNPTGMSNQEIIDSIQNPTNQGGSGEKISNNTTTVDGNTAYGNIYIVNDSDRFNQTMKEQQIYFIKNGTTYVLIFDAPENTFDKEKSNFDITLNSFKVL
jgi:hypothetical protein